MQSGMINKIVITPANVIDSKGFKHAAPNSGAVYADKRLCNKISCPTQMFFHTYPSNLSQNNWLI